MSKVIMKKRSRSRVNAVEHTLGVQSKTTAQAYDFFSNILARTGAGTSSLENGTQYSIERWTLNYWSVMSVLETSWVARRIVEAPAQDIVKTWPVVLGEIDPDGLTKMDRAIRKTNTKNQVLDAIVLGRVFGGAGALIVIKGDENRLDEPLDLDKIELGAYKGITVFDRWSGITPGTDICSDIDRPLDFGLPEYYDCRGRDGASFRVHSSRILRFCGPMMPEPERSAYQGWGISVLAPVIQTIASYDNVSYNALALSFRAQIIGMKVPELAALMSGLGSNQNAAAKFAQRMQGVNELMSNQSMVLLPDGGELSKIDYSFSGLAELKQAFQLDVSGAAKMPVSLLWGRTLNGLGQAGDGDERIYEKTIATEGDITLRPALEKLYPVVAVSTIGEVPDDMDLMFPSIRVLTEQEKAELAKATVDSVTVCINSGIFSPRTGGKEIKQSSSTTGFGTNLTDDAIEKLSDDIQAEGELGEGLFGEEGGKTLDPSSSPTGVLKETDKLKAGKPTPKGAGEPGGASEEHEEASEGEAEDAFDEDGLLRDPDDVAPVSLSKRRVMDVDLRQGVTLCQQCRARLNGDDNAEVNGKVVCPNCAAAYHRAKAKDADGPQAGPKRSIHGLSLVIETPAGYERHGRDKKNVPWRQTMAHDYGYIVGHAGADGDSLDCYLGPDSSADWCYVVDQSVLGDRRRFDESKVLLGFASQGDALRAYKANHHRAKDVYLDFTPMHVNDFKAWLASRNPRRPCSPEALK